MTTTGERAWVDRNQCALQQALEFMRARWDDPGRDDPDASPPVAPPIPPALAGLVRTFGLSEFERDLVLLCAGVELDGGFATALAAVADATTGRRPTFGLALALLSDPHWSALTPSAPLRRWRLVEVEDGPSLTNSPIRIDERVLHHLAGIDYLDGQLETMTEVLVAPEVLAASQRAVVDEIVRVWGDAPGPLPVVELIGGPHAGLADIAAVAARRLGSAAVRMPVAAIPPGPPERHRLARLWEREVALTPLVLVVDATEAEVVGDDARGFVGDAGGPMIVLGRGGLASSSRGCLRLTVPAPSRRERQVLWQTALDDHDLDVDVAHRDALADQFRLDAGRISATVDELVLRLDGVDATDPLDLAWDLCRTLTRSSIDGLADQMEPSAGWADLVVPDSVHRVLADIVAHVRRRGQVHGDWGFASGGRRGLGTSVLFSGPSGTGKTMAAEVLAGALRLDLYRIDLSQVVSKYIGETEKNLARLFDAADGGGVVLLFDEADALFGKRSEVTDSHDRYANIEVSYLLQRMESFDGVAILTTNLRNALDQAFLRRLRFIVAFPFPDEQARAAIWRGMFPAETPTTNLDVEALARLHVTGGSIRNIALNAAIRAADDGRPVDMGHLLETARAEAAKLERPLAAAETRGWIPAGGVA